MRRPVRSSQFSTNFKRLLLTAIFSAIANYRAASVSEKDFNSSSTSKSCACPNVTSENLLYDCDSNQGCFRCLNSTDTISIEAVCDYVMDCPDLSDEILCSKNDYQNKFIKEESMRNRLLNQSLMGGPCWKFNFSRNLFSTCGDKECSKLKIGRTSWQICNCSFEFCPKKNVCPSDCNGEGTCQDLQERSDVLQMFSIPLTVTGFIIGISAILGNIAVLFLTARNLSRGRPKLTVEQRLTKYFFFSLSLSDLILAIYTVAICAILRDLTYTEVDDLQYNHWVMRCDVLGALAVIGSEQSVLTMLLITALRLYGIARPFSRIRLRVFMISLLICWILSVLIATFPLISALNDLFVQVVRQNDAPVLTLITKDSVEDLNDILQTYSKSDESSRPRGSWDKLLYFMKELFGVENTYHFGYYHGLGLCLPNYFPMASSKSMWYSLMIFILNLSCFLLMAIGYIVIYKYRRRPRGDIRRNYSADAAESRKLKKKISLILFTDFLCWIPVCAVGFANIQQHGLPNRDCNQSDIREELTASLFAILLVLPINSAVNPFLYSAAPDYLHQRLAAFFTIVKDKVLSSTKDCYVDEYDDSCNSVGQNSTIVETISEYPDCRGSGIETIKECHL